LAQKDDEKPENEEKSVTINGKKYKLVDRFSEKI